MECAYNSKFEGRIDENLNTQHLHAEREFVTDLNQNASAWACAQPSLADICDFCDITLRTSAGKNSTQFVANESAVTIDSYYQSERRL